VSFTPPSDNGGAPVTDYEYSIDGGDTWRRLSTPQLTSPLLVTGLTNGVQYSVKLRAINMVGTGTASNGLLAMPVAPASAPDISSVVVGNHEVSLTVTPPMTINDAFLSGYDYSLNDGSTWIPFTLVSGSFTIVGLTNGTTYQIRVRAVNTSGGGVPSEAVTVTPDVLPVAPSVIMVSKLTPTSVGLSWSTTDNGGSVITGYQIRLSSNAGITWSNAISTGRASPSFTMGNLSAGTAYVVQVAARNASGTSTWSATSFTFRTLAKQSQSITFLQPKPVIIGKPDVTLSAKTSAPGLQITWSIAPASKTVCSLVGKKLHAKKVGLCKVTATQSGNATYKPALSVTRTVVIKRS